MENLICRVEAFLESLAPNPWAHATIFGVVVTRVDEDAFVLPDVVGWVPLTMGDAARRILGCGAEVRS